MITQVKAVFFVTLLLILAASPVRAESGGVTSDSVITGLAVVEGFHRELQASLKDLPASVDASEILRASEEGRGRAAKDIQSLKWSVAAGRKRYRRVFLIVEPYMKTVISSLKDRGATLNREEKARLEQIIAQLNAIKRGKLKTLEESLKSEIPDARREAPVPAVDQPRGERPPAGGATIWDR